MTLVRLGRRGPGLERADEKGPFYLPLGRLCLTTTTACKNTGLATMLLCKEAVRPGKAAPPVPTSSASKRGHEKTLDTMRDMIIRLIVEEISS